MQNNFMQNNFWCNCADKTEKEL